MGNKMTRQSRAELANAIRARYRSATGEQKRKTLDAFIAVTGHHRQIGPPTARLYADLFSR